MSTPVYIISGFLGSGKTTFLNHLIQQLPKNLRLAIVVNEFGDISIDGKLIEQEDYFVSEITQGCVCCTLKIELAEALKSIIHEQKPDFIIIETSGLARPSQIVEMWPADVAVCRGIVCLLDATLYESAGDDLPIINNQINDAEVIILNKTDLLSKENLVILRERLLVSTEGKKKIHETSFGKSDYRELFPELSGDISTKHKLCLGRGHISHGHNHVNSTEGFSSISLKTIKTVPAGSVETFLCANMDKITRAKGVLRTDAGNKVFQISSGRLDISDYRKDILEEGSLVLIMKDENLELLKKSLPDFFLHSS